MKRDEKIKAVSFNNRKKQLTVTYASGKTVSTHYAVLGIKSLINNAWVDNETKGRSIGFEFENGKKDYMPFDQPLFGAKDPDFLLINAIEHLTARIKDEIKAKKISKRFLSEKLNTSDNQLGRLLNPNILNKNLTQLFKIAAILDLKIEIKLKKAA